MFLNFKNYRYCLFSDIIEKKNININNYKVFANLR
jgi:hypothetical protein